ncbi:unnamed protein product [Blepharisma stoltei]|uniref:Receptor ligand binding region domain-containing protein n=1 Tax=Blepharisma stoltei TaxID=1481888 RepID=A0AAU9K234_9CILI|nr:unnamed protein product [Blepharisma stoltei]
MKNISKSTFSSYHGLFKLLYLALVALSASSEVLIVYSNSSKSIVSSIIEEMEANISSLEIFSCDFSLLKEEIALHTNLLAIFDITSNLDSQFSISKLCQDNSLIHFLVSDDLLYHNKWTFSLSSSKNSLNQAFTTALNYFNWNAGTAFSNIENYPTSKTILSSYSENIILFPVGSDTSIKDLISREIMKFGSSLFYLFTEKNKSIEIQETLSSSKMLINGTGILLIGESSYESSINGALAIVEKGREAVSSNESYLSVAILELINLLKNSSNINNCLLLLSKTCPDHYCAHDFSLINIQNNQRKLVGTIKKENLVLNSVIEFPGDSFDVPTSQKKVLYISANDGTTNPGMAPTQAVELYKRGLTLAMKDMNDGINTLQNFQLKLNDFDCGASAYNADFNYNCIYKDKNKLGLARIMSLASVIAYGEMATLAKLNNTIPCVGYLNIDPGLSNSTKYPFYTRIIFPSDALYSQGPLLFKVMGWANLAVLYENSSLGIWGNYYFSLAAEKQNLKIVNNLRVIPPNLTRDQIRSYTNVVKEIVDSNVRMVVLILSPPLIDYAAELFYDLGMRKGDVVFFSPNTGWLSSVAAKDDYTYKRIEIGIPVLTLFQSVFVGEKGKKVYDNLYEIYGNTEPASYSCLYYDSAYLIGAALDWTISQGKDYTDPYKLQSAIRSVKFAGCSGTVYIQKNSNNVQISSFTIQSNSYNATTGIVRVFDVGYFTPTSTQLLKIKTPFVYPDGTTNKPTDFRITRTDCPFDDKLRRTFGKGRALAFGICFFVTAVTGIITFIIWKEWWNKEIKELTTKEELSVPDMIAGATIVVEFFQLLSQGPDIRPLNSFLANIGDAVSLDLNSFIKLENGVFWWISTTIIVLCFLWTIFCIEIFLRLDEKFSHVWFFKTLGVIADQSTPILGNLCFIQFISILLDIFVCDHSIGNDFTDSYLSIDCYQFC